MKTENQKLDCRVILAAGGNPTGIVLFDDDSNRGQYAEIAKGFMAEDSSIEQFGFLEGTKHFQMSGGEFCGNAARASAFIIAEKTGETSGQFTMSGFDGIVNYTILDSGEVRCTFPGLPMDLEVKHLSNGLNGSLVDLGGIIHFVVSSDFAFSDNEEWYKKIHSEVVEELGLSSRGAVGVIWQSGSGKNIRIDPVVWVRDIDSFFYETACGSGTLAALAASSLDLLSVVQPSGEAILAGKDGDTYILQSNISEVL